MLFLGPFLHFVQSVIAIFRFFSPHNYSFSKFAWNFWRHFDHNFKFMENSQLSFETEIEFQKEAFQKQTGNGISLRPSSS